MLFRSVLSALYGTALGGNILFHYTLKDIVLYLGQVLYFILCTRYTGTTPGKRVMNLRVISVEENGELDLLTVVYRETVGRFLSSIFVCIGYLIIGVDREKRGFHDMLCDTRVVYGKRVKVYPVYPYAQARPVETPPVYPAEPQSGPYHMVDPDEQNAHPAEAVPHILPNERQQEAFGAGGDRKSVV